MIREGHPKAVSEHRQAAIVREEGHLNRRRLKIRSPNLTHGSTAVNAPPFSQRTHLSNRSPLLRHRPPSHSKHAHSTPHTPKYRRELAACSRYVLVRLQQSIRDSGRTQLLLLPYTNEHHRDHVRIHSKPNIFFPHSSLSSRPSGPVVHNKNCCKL
jgi:hypothetical protein